MQVDFLDADGNKFTLSLMGAADNSLCTNAPFLLLHADALSFEAKEGKPVLLNLDDAKYAASCKALEPASADGAAEQDLPDDQPEEDAYSAELRDASQTVTAKSRTFLLKFVNAALLRTPLREFPGELVTLKGRPLIEAIETLSGKPVVYTKEKANPNAKKGEALSRKELAAQQVQQYTDLLTHLKSFGALLDTVKVELLLSFEEFQKLGPGADRPRTGGSEVSAAEAEAMHYHFYFERNWDVLSTCAWMNLTYQCIRTFVANRVTLRFFRQLPGIAESGGSAQPSDSTLAASNVYSVPESILLNWLTFHHKKLYPREDLRVANFSTDLRSGRVLAAVLLSHAPQLKNLVMVHMATSDKRTTWESNAKEVIAALTELGFDLVPTIADLTEPNARSMMLFVLYLIQQLPSYVPKSTIEFSCRLNESVLKNIELSNPSAKPIQYTIKRDGSEDFHLKGTSVRIEPRSTVLFPIEFRSRFSHTSEAVIMFISKKDSATAVASTLVFKLVSSVNSFKPVDVSTFESRLYDTQTIELDVANPFAQDCEFEITLHEIRPDASAAALAASKGKAKPTGAKRKSVNISTAAKPDKDALGSAASVLPSTSFKSSRERLAVKGAERVTLTVSFFGFHLSQHKCHVHFLDKGVGEFVYEIIGNVTLPPPIDLVKVSGPFKPQVEKELIIPPRNGILEKARVALTDRMGAVKAKEFLKAMNEIGPIVYNVEFTSPLMSGPDKVIFCEPSYLSKLQSKLFKLQQAKAASQPGTVTEIADEVIAAAPALDREVLLALLNRQIDNKLSFTLNAKGAGSYTSKVILRSEVETKVIEIEASLTASGTLASLEFSCAARQTITQHIPITNTTNKEWVLSVQLSGEGFEGPRDFRVPEGQTAQYPLKFRPTWVCDVTGELTMQVMSTQDKFAYNLRGIGEEPLAEGHIHVTCQARTRTMQKFAVFGVAPRPATYKVESDLPFVSGPPNVTVNKGQTVDYELTFYPTSGGLQQGSVMFVAPTGEFTWYTLEVETKPPPAERTIAMEATVRQAVAAEISIANPLSETVHFDVNFVGEGLLGNRELVLEAKESTVFELVYSPLLAVSADGSVGFVSDKVRCC
jgi:hypothetical protein